MGKNGSRLISIQQYRLADLFLFAIILALAELLEYFAIIWLPDAATYTFSLMLPITLIVMMRWGWPSIFYAAGCGLIYCLLYTASLQLFITYIFGNACIGLMLVYLHFVGKKRTASKWYLSALFVLIAWLVVNLARSVIYTAFGNNFGASILSFISLSDNGVLSLVVGILLIVVMRRFDGMFEDQKSYLKRVDEERKEKARRDAFGDEPVEIDEQSLSILKKTDDDLY
jgi:hypothetical protein